MSAVRRGMPILRNLGHVLHASLQPKMAVMSAQMEFHAAERSHSILVEQRIYVARSCFECRPQDSNRNSVPWAWPTSQISHIDTPGQLTLGIQTHRPESRNSGALCHLSLLVGGTRCQSRYPETSLVVDRVVEGDLYVEANIIGRHRVAEMTRSQFQV